MQKYSLWSKSCLQIHRRWLIAIPIEIIGNFQTVIGILPVSTQDIINNSFHWLTNLFWYWQIIILLLLAHWIFMNNANKIYKEGMEGKDIEIEGLRNELNNRRVKDELAIRIREFYDKHRNAQGQYNLGQLCNDIVALLKNKGIVSEALIDEFNHPIEQWFHLPVLDAKIRALIATLKYTNEK